MLKGTSTTSSICEAIFVLILTLHITGMVWCGILILLLGLYLTGATASRISVKSQISFDNIMQRLWKSKKIG